MEASLWFDFLCILCIMILNVLASIITKILSPSIVKEELDHDSNQMMVEDDINTRPAQDSPKNIVNILNDDCIQLILRKLDNINDFWNAAKVCVRFQTNAKTCFPFKKVCFGYDECDTHVSFDSAEDFLSLFGPRIKFIHCEFIPFYMNHEENLNLILQSCGKTLQELKINSIFKTNVTIGKWSPFQALKKLTLTDVSFSNFNPLLMFPELQSFKMNCIYGPVNWLANQFPMLQYVEMYSIEMLTDEIFIEFLTQNPQLQSFHISNCHDLTTLVWENIGDRLPNIVELSLDQVGMITTQSGTLKQLKNLQIFDKMSDIPSESKSFFSALVTNNQSIEELRIRGVDVELGRILQQLKMIKSLHIDNTSEDILLDLVKQLPALEHLFVGGWKGLDWTYEGIRLLTVRKIIQNCEKLIELQIYNDLNVEGTVDLNEYDSIVALATGRVEVYFESLAFRGTNRDMLANHFKNKINDWVYFWENI